MKNYVSAAALVAGVVLLVWGLQASDSFGSDVSRFFTGEPTDRTIWLILAGSVLAVVGLLGFVRGKKAIV